MGKETSLGKEDAVCETADAHQEVAQELVDPDQLHTEKEVLGLIKSLVGKRRAHLVNSRTVGCILEALDKVREGKKDSETNALDAVRDVAEAAGLSEKMADGDVSAANEVFDALESKTLEQAAQSIPSIAKLMKRDPIRDYRENIGRNHKCSCGSGKKYKKCCGRRK